MGEAFAAGMPIWNLLLWTCSDDHLQSLTTSQFQSWQDQAAADITNAAYIIGAQCQSQ